MCDSPNFWPKTIFWGDCPFLGPVPAYGFAWYSNGLKVVTYRVGRGMCKPSVPRYKCAPALVIELLTLDIFGIFGMPFVVIFFEHGFLFDFWQVLVPFWKANRDSLLIDASII